jgi:uncharacterized damage-inducible protein DinB
MTRSPDEISKLLEYNDWANARTLETVTPLAQEELDRQLGGSFPSVRETLVHIYAAEWIWLERWHGTSPKGLPSANELATLETLKERWAKVEQKRQAFAGSLSEARLGETVSYSNLKGDGKKNRLNDLIVHLVNHSSYHRGQVATMLRQLGKKPVSTDYVFFLDSVAK